MINVTHFNIIDVQDILIHYFGWNVTKSGRILKRHSKSKPALAYIWFKVVPSGFLLLLRSLPYLRDI